MNNSNAGESLTSCDLLIRNIHLATMDPARASINPDWHHKSASCPYNSIRQGAILVRDGKIVWAGVESELPKDSRAKTTIDGQGQWLTPGLIDCHTHLVYAGDRSREFEQRLEGVSYETIAKQGGGILSTVKATRAATVDELVADSRPRLEALLAEGVTTLEIKSGYGLDTETETKMLQAASLLASEYPVTVIRTFLGAHALPPEYQNRADDYIEHVCTEMIPAIAKGQLADAVDVFCENIAFSPEQTEQVFKAAKAHGLGIKLHGEQLSDSGGTQLAVKHQALSVDHLEYLSQSGIDALKNSNTVATLLPGAFYFLRETKLPPVDGLREAGVPIAIATDLNPGTSPLASIRLMMNMACTLFRMTPSEALAGCTRNAAQALGLQEKTGRIKEGLDADLLLWPVSHPASLAAGLTGISPSLIIKSGQIVKSTISSNQSFSWSGRIDQETDSQAAQRWHQKVRPYAPGGEKGVALLGFESDEGVRRNQGRPGAAKGPDHIRQALTNLPWNRNAPVWDVGNIRCNGTDLEQAQQSYARQMCKLLDNGHLVIGLGGGHEIGWASYRGLMKHLEKPEKGKDSHPVKVGIINFDAHFDLRLPEVGPSSGTPFWQASEYAREQNIPFNYFCLGISESSNTRALFNRADELGVTYRLDRAMTLLNLPSLQQDIRQFIDKVDHIYLTIDIDAFPASLAPGVSAPAARGIPPEVVEPLLDTIKHSGKLKLFDIAETCPKYDIDAHTARLAARLIHQLAGQNPLIATNPGP
ncbi:imidazolonepropionase [Endozoicomonas sp. SCSIO W0465]|uniref:imidazolonepropionase n=1 Tax=Endozoicomonas sp. SCSIO W0465 TaxID=2918516 RepID=UPI002074E781|nr:imidazolonepropionase [Endozoicomonas sp. SCSIO W0465]USE37572.1 imidazolonepropionase [Endozoicomonas sp. SCSIO W0465]